MKKELNNSMNETATMPSYFPCIKSSSWTATETTCRLPKTYLHVTARLRPCKKEDMVIEKETIELNSDAAVDPTDTFED